MADPREAVFGRYQPPTRLARLPKTNTVWFGEDDLYTWDTSRFKLICNFNCDLLPTHGATRGARGELIEWERPASLPPTWNLSALDYTYEDWQTLQSWQYMAQAVRIFVWGRFWLRCRIASIPIAGPLGKTLPILLTNRQLLVYQDGMASAPWNGTVIHGTYNNPFYISGTFGDFYGGVVP